MKHLFLFSLFSFLLVACKKEGCTYPEATNYSSEAEKDDGSCMFELAEDTDEDPEPDPRDAFIGTYTITDSSFGGGTVFVDETIYSLNITTEGTVSDTIYLNNLSNNATNYFAIITGSSFAIPTQTESGPYTLFGNGSFDGDQITYETFSGPGNDFVHEGVGSK